MTLQVFSFARSGAVLIVLVLGGTAGASGAGAFRAGTQPGKAGAAAPLVELRVKHVVLINDAPAVLLVDAPEHRYLLIFIDIFMAAAIQAGALQVPGVRSTSHVRSRGAPPPGGE